MRVTEDEVKRRRYEAGCRADIPLPNFWGIELRHGSAGFIKGLLIDIF